MGLALILHYLYKLQIGLMIIIISIPILLLRGLNIKPILQ